MKVNPRRNVTVFAPGAERSPLICIDDFALEPNTIVAMAAEAAFIQMGSTYPGVRAPAPAAYIDALLAGIQSLLHEVFGARARLQLELCAFSMVTTGREALTALQRIPHFDGPEPTRFAFLHYLCPPERGGTSFYRHRATAYECVTPERLSRYRKRLRDELRAGPPNGYINGDTASFERIHRVGARFNRLVIYKGNALHSGDIPDHLELTEDPLAGRLTINGFGHLETR